MIPVTKTTLPPLEEYISRLEGIWKTGQVTNNGPLCRELGECLQNYLKVPRMELVSNGTLALQLAIKALGLTGEIITTPYSYVATTNAILWEGCQPVFVDIDPQTFCIDARLIEAAVTDQTSAVLATHVYGYPCDVDRIEQVARKYNLKVIYDAAHAFGVKFNGRSLLLHGDCSTLSFHATKLFHTAEGGAVICKHGEVARKVFIMARFGHIGEDNYLDIGINAKLSELHASMGLVILPKVKEIVSGRRQRSIWYDECFAGCNVQRPQVSAGLEYNYAYYPVLFASSEKMSQVRQALLDNNIGPRRYFYPSLNTLPFLHPVLQRKCPVSESIAKRVLALPLWHQISRTDIERVASVLRRCL